MRKENLCIPYGLHIVITVPWLFSWIERSRWNSLGNTNLGSNHHGGFFFWRPKIFSIVSANNRIPIDSIASSHRRKKPLNIVSKWQTAYRFVSHPQPVRIGSANNHQISFLIIFSFKYRQHIMLCIRLAKLWNCSYPFALFRPMLFCAAARHSLTHC